MHISFYPALGTHSRVPVGSHGPNTNRDEDGVRAAFTAYLSPQDYAEAARSGLRIEVWTNAPSGTRPAGEWGPIAFQEVDETAAQPGVEEAVPDVILSSEDRPPYLSPGEAQTSSTHVFRAEFTIPHVPGWIFAFTYRLVYPSGICWLGSDRDNGVLELDERSAFFEEIGSWKTEGERRVHADDMGPESSDADDYSVLGKLDVSEWTWAGWATDGSRVWSFGDTCLEQVDDAVLAYLVPTAFDTSLLLPRSYVFHAQSKESHFSITSHGHIVTSNQNSPTIAYREHESSSASDLDLLRSEIESLCPAPHVFSTQDTDTVLFTPSRDSEVSMTIYAHNLRRSPAPLRPISLPIRAFDAFANFPGTISIFVPETRKSYFVDRSEGAGHLTLKYGPRGADFVISAVYGIAGNSASPSGWQFAIPECPAAPERVALSANAEENPLPTPPASPVSRPQRSVSFVLPVDDDAEGGLRQRKPAEPPVLAPERGTVARRLLRNDSAFERYQAAPLREKILVLVTSATRLLARFMGVAVLRFILFGLRVLFGKGKESQTDGNTEEDRQPASVPPQDESGVQTIGIIATGSNNAAGASGVEKDAAEAPIFREYSTDAGERGRPGSIDNQDSSTPSTKAAAHGLKWVLPFGDVAPIRLLVRSDAKPEELLEHLEIELNGGEVKHISSVYGVDEKTSVVEITRLEGGTASELLVKLKS